MFIYIVKIERTFWEKNYEDSFEVDAAFEAKEDAEKHAKILKLTLKNEWQEFDQEDAGEFVVSIQRLKVREKSEQAKIKERNN